MSKPLVIIIPGLGDEGSVEKTRYLTKLWGSKFEIKFFDSKWSSNEPYSQKIVRLTKFINSQDKSPKNIVAYSAGGALAMGLINSDLKLNKLVLVSCKLKGADSIGVKYQKRATALVDAVKASEQAIDKLTAAQKDKIVCLIPFFDGVVSKQDMRVLGTTKKTIPFITHAGSIGFAMIFTVRKLFR